DDLASGLTLGLGPWALGLGPDLVPGASFVLGRSSILGPSVVLGCRSGAAVAPERRILTGAQIHEMGGSTRTRDQGRTKDRGPSTDQGPRPRAQELDQLA